MREASGHGAVGVSARWTFFCVCVPYILKIHFSCRCRRENVLVLLFKIWNTAALCYCGFTFPSWLMVWDHFPRVHPTKKKKGRILFCCQLVFNLAAQANLLHGHSHDQLIAVCANVNLGSKNRLNVLEKGGWRRWIVFHWQQRGRTRRPAFCDDPNEESICSYRSVRRFN